MEQELEIILETEEELNVMLETEEELNVMLETEEELNVMLETEEELNVMLETQEKLLDVDLEIDTVEIIKTDVEIYEGPYEITPLASQEQELETKDKILEENIKVKEIPFFETSNQYGNTIYIGSEVC